MEDQILVRDKTEYITQESIPSIDHLKRLNERLEVKDAMHLTRVGRTRGNESSERNRCDIQQDKLNNSVSRVWQCKSFT
jgi:hypothetical protein